MATPPPSPEERLKAMLKLAGLSERPSYHAAEVCKLLSIHQATFYRMISAGTLGYIKSRGGYRVDWASLVHHIGENERDMQ